MTENRNDTALKRGISRFMRGASVEITPHDEKSLEELKDLLPPHSVLYVAHVPKASIMDVVKTAGRVQEAGFEACAHIAARRVAGEAELRMALLGLRERGCSRILLIAGDNGAPAGPYAGTVEILKSGVIQECGIRHVRVAGHPQGNKDIELLRLWQALRDKQAFAEQTGVDVQIVTQFGFDGQAIVDWLRELRDRGISLPVHVGLAGPTPLHKLVRYAMLCGIGTSLKAAMSHKGILGGLTDGVKAVDEVLSEFVRGCSAADRAALAGAHLFSFGGCVATARWLNAVAAGNFEIKRDNTGFNVRD